MNVNLANKLVDHLSQQGVAEWIVCAGSRNAPLVKILSKISNIKVHYFFEERSAAYFAIGRIHKRGAPTAVVTTSGTAVANLLPAVIEAHYQELPLVLVTADRPTSYRNTGAPQAIDQMNIFSGYSEQTIDWDVESEICWSQEKPLHVNICFDEPLIDNEIHVRSVEIGNVRATSKSKIDQYPNLEKFKKPLVIGSCMSRSQAEELAPLLGNSLLPLYLECGSNLKQLIKGSHVLNGGEFALQHYVNRGWVDSIVRIGGVPTTRLWRDLEYSSLPVLSLSTTRFSGLARESQVTPLRSLSKDSLAKIFLDLKFDGLDQFLEQDHLLTELLKKSLKHFSHSEIGLLQKFFNKLGDDDQLFIGNSLPIREMDLLDWQQRNSQVSIYTQRGVNGIDGLVSTALGLADSQRKTWALIGDLTFMYDLAGLWALKINPDLNFNLVVVNNGGGKIFSRIFADPLFENRHGLTFESIAKFWGLNYLLVRSGEDFENLDTQNTLIEIWPDGKESQSLWNQIKTITA
ncbi:MAG: 2-succinyl-5-enolpyruvyl-6-hydroxy-3-cyclohexene-1-carboxylic-acid synthase [Bdellovibrionales bacterium]